MILDESKESDEPYEMGGIHFVMSKPAVAALQKRSSVVAIDYVDGAQGKGFRLFLKPAVSKEQTAAGGV